MLFAFAKAETAASAYLFAFAVTLSFGLAALFLTAGKRQESDFRSALLLVVLWWGAAPVFAAIPLVMEGMAWADAYFETVSALTTTGAWISNQAMLSDETGMLWRAMLQWLGGLASMAIAAAIFIRPAFIGIDTLLPPFSRGDRDSYLRPIRNAVVAFAAPYAVLTAIAFAALLISGVSEYDAAILALSTMASGGMVPHTNGLEAYSSASVATLFPFILLSGANFVLIARLMRGVGIRGGDLETGTYLLILLFVGFLFWVTAGAGDVALIPAQLFNAAGFLSTSGLSIGEGPTLVAAMLTAIIGGAAISTAGGFKIVRWLVIMRRANAELRRLVSPSGVFDGTRVANELGVWMHFLVFTFMLGVFVLAVTAGGHSFEIAAATATAVLSNTGPLLGFVEGGESGYEIFSGPLRVVLIVGMILGRLEAVAALALISRAFWRS